MRYHISPELMHRIETIQRGAYAGSIPSSCEIIDVNINGHVRNLSDWLVICGVDIHTFASRCRPSWPVARVLGLTCLDAQYLDKTPTPITHAPSRSLNRKRRMTILRRYLARMEPDSVHPEATLIAARIMFEFGYDAYRQGKDFIVKPTTFYPHLAIISIHQDQHNYDQAIAMLARHQYIFCHAKNRYQTTAIAHDSLYTDKIWTLGSRQADSWLATYRDQIDPEMIYSTAKFFLGKSPGIEALRKQCRRHGLSRPRTLSGSALLALLAELDSRAGLG